MPCHAQSLLFHHHNVAAGFETRIESGNVKDDKEDLQPTVQMKVALEVAKEQEMLSPVAAKHGVEPVAGGQLKRRAAGGLRRHIRQGKNGVRKQGAGEGMTMLSRRSGSFSAKRNFL